MSKKSKYFSAVSPKEKMCLLPMIEHRHCGKTVHTFLMNHKIIASLWLDKTSKMNQVQLSTEHHHSH